MWRLKLEILKFWALTVVFLLFFIPLLCKDNKILPHKHFHSLDFTNLNVLLSPKVTPTLQRKKEKQSSPLSHLTDKHWPLPLMNVIIFRWPMTVAANIDRYG